MKSALAAVIGSQLTLFFQVVAKIELKVSIPIADLASKGGASRFIPISINSVKSGVTFSRPAALGMGITLLERDCAFEDILERREEKWCRAGL